MLKKLLTSPYFSLFSFLFSIGFAMYFYVASQSVSEISYSESSEIIFKSHHQFPISAKVGKKYFEEGYIILFKYVFWNSGNTPLAPKALRRKLAIRSESVEFIKSNISHSDPGYSDFNSTIDSESVTFDWNFFDPNAYFQANVLVWSDKKILSLRPSAEMPNFEGLFAYCDNPLSRKLLLIAIGILFGILALIPLIFLTSAIEESDNFFIFGITGSEQIASIIVFLLGLIGIVYSGIGIVILTDVLLFSNYPDKSHFFISWLEFPEFAKIISCNS